MSMFIQKSTDQNATANSHHPLEKGVPCLFNYVKRKDSSSRLHSRLPWLAHVRGNDTQTLWRLFAVTSDKSNNQKGSALIIAIIVLVILGAMGLAALDVADFNILVAANDRDSKEAFFHADSGANMGHVFLKEALEDVNSTFYNSTAATWSAIFNATDFPLQLYQSGTNVTHIRAGAVEVVENEGDAQNMAAGYEFQGGSAPGGTRTVYLIRSHRIGARNSNAEVDLGWQLLNL